VEALPHLDEQAILDWLSGDLPPDRREAMLAHVDRCDLCRELAAEAQRGTVGGATLDPPADPTMAGGRVRAGAVLAARFELLERLGAGAMGVVWRARDRTTNQDLALKLLPEERAQDEAFLARFRDELLLARQVSHPNVCRLHDLVQADGRWFLTMELIEGAPLSAVAAGGPLEVDRVEALLRQVAAGLAAAHQAGVVHRDLKPANVVVTGDGRAVVLDFGIARRDGEEGRTEVGAIVGTPRYMAPEQAATSKVDARADVYALGLIGCELLSGHVPLDRGDMLPTIVARRLEDPPSVESLAPSAPPRLARILDACLRRDPDERPSDGAAVLALLEGRAELPQPRPEGRRRLLLPALAVAVLIAGLAIWRGVGVTEPPPLVLGAFTVEDPADAWLARGLPGFIDEELRDGWGLEARWARDASDTDVGALVTGEARRTGGGPGASATARFGSREVSLAADTPRELGLALAAWLADEHPASSTLPTRADLEETGCVDREAWRTHRRARRAEILGEYNRASALAEGADCEQDPTEPVPRADGAPLDRVDHAASLVADGELDRGFARLEALSRQGPERAVALRTLAGLEVGCVDGWLSRAPAPERGLLHAEQAVEAAPHDVGALALRGLARVLAGDHDGAQQDATQALRWSVQPPEAAVLTLVTSAAMQSRWDDAAAAARRLLEADELGRDAEAMVLLGDVDLARGAFERGLERLAEAALRYEQRDDPVMAADTWLLLSWSQELLGDPTAAAASMSLAAAADPALTAPGGEAELALRAIERSEAMGRGEPTEPLLPWYRQRLEGSEDDGAERDVLRHIELYAAWQDGDLTEVAAIHRAIALGPYVETWAAFPAAEAAEQAGDRGAAAAHYRTLVEDPYSWEEPILTARARLGLGRVLAELGQADEARVALEAFIAAWDQAPTDAPELRDARRILAGLSD
jgi:tRNA A-37 threonylcarbamoyl transferase component Bud32/tetratricopeptide (TPR) repeat protein